MKAEKNIIGRKREINLLNKAYKSGQSEFVVVYGRRRVGKTFLIREHFNHKFDFYLTGLANGSTEKQLVSFNSALITQTNSDNNTDPESWFEAFQRLIKELERKDSKQKKVVFLDEMPWLDTPRSDFIMALEHFWNSWASSRKDILLIACGSAASWMINKLINNHGGLHNRVTQRIKMYPFTLGEVKLMLRANNVILDHYQILQLYMVMGGIPFYIQAIEPGKSAPQIIEELCFRKDALLAIEFPNLFKSLFKNAQNHEKIVYALASKTKGMTRKEIIATTKLPSGGSITKILNELEESGFITGYHQYQQKTKDTYYRLSDFYSAFYLKFIEKNRTYAPGTWINRIDHPAQRAWSGFAFEQVVLVHQQQVRKALAIGGVYAVDASWKSKKSNPGAQIDLLIDRRDQVVNLCELKYSLDPFTITKAYADNLRNKIGVFRAETKTRKSLFLTMITTFGLVQNEHALSLVQSSITMDALFEIINE